MRHVIIIPARNEAEYIRATLDSISNQTETPDRVYVVDDGSTDSTPEIVASMSRDKPYICLLRKEDRGARLMGGGVVETFNFAYSKCRTEDFVYISKIDADLVFPPDYFKILLDFMDRNTNVGVASGVIYENIGSRRTKLRLPKNHVPGALKTYRRHVFDEIGGFVPVLGWDIIDLVKVRSLGYSNVHLTHLEVSHLRQHAAAEGLFSGKAKWGEGAYIIGSHPLFVLGRGIYRMFENPYVTGGIAFWWGYLRAAATGVPRISDKELIKSLRKEQLKRLFLFNILRGAAPTAKL